MIFDSLQNNPQMVHMFLLIPRINEDMINNDDNEQVRYCLNTLFIKSIKDAEALFSTYDIVKNS